VPETEIRMFNCEGFFVLRPALFYLCLMFPFIVRIYGGDVYVAGNGDIWNSIWTWHHITENWIHPFYTSDLNAPYGGTFVPNDIVGGYIFALFSTIASSISFYNYYSLFCFWLFCYGVHLWVQKNNGDGYIAGSIVYAASAFRCIIHNGSSEMLTVALLPLVLFYWTGVDKHKKHMFIVGCLMILLCFGSWYGAIMMFGMILALETEWSRRKKYIVGLLSMVMLSWALFTKYMLLSSSIIDIKQHHMELAAIRRSYGVADIRSYFFVYPFNAPDFSLLSFFSEDFYHVTYIGWLAIFLCIFGFFQDKNIYRWRYALIGGFFLLLSLGPVVVIDAQALLFFGTYVIPLPYLLLEQVWGFEQLTLLYRFSMVPLLVVAYFAGQILYRSKWKVFRIALIVGILFEGVVISPTKDIPKTITPPSVRFASFQFENLDKGNMILFPIGHIGTSLIEQKEHTMPLMSTLNRTASKKSLQFWKQIENVGWKNCVHFMKQAYDFEIHYVLIDRRQVIFPSKISGILQSALESCPPSTIKTSTTHQLISIQKN
jgi:hypothetical protein